LFQFGKHREAQAEYEKALLLQPTSVQAGVGLGNALAAFNRYDEALAAFGRALASDAPCWRRRTRQHPLSAQGLCRWTGLV
jgi:tetratricopeptide (TPR) repeat protein